VAAVIELASIASNISSRVSLIFSEGGEHKTTPAKAANTMTEDEGEKI
jgi:hypothetical protein